MILTRKVRAIVEAALCLTYPQRCLLCGSIVESRSLGVTCEECWSLVRLFSSTDSVCWKCCRPTVDSSPEISDVQIMCHECDEQYFTAARACGVYEGALRQNVLELKKRPYLPAKFSELLVNAAKQSPLSTSTRIVPIPLHPSREKKRGFNQASIMARSLAKEIRLPVDELSTARVRHSEKYRAGLDFKARSETVAEAFEVIQPRLISNETILLLDDVFTTGATASNCAKALINAGAKSVFVLTLARPGH